jgi:alkylated DNA repair dioxygenase AlkB
MDQNHQQIALFKVDGLPEGFRYQPDLISGPEEEALLAQLARQPFKEFLFQGFVGKRRVVSYGWSYDFNERALRPAQEIPDFLLPVRERAAAFAGVAAEQLRQVLLTEYDAGASIGWHRDKKVFGDVIGISLLSSCRFRFRRKIGSAWQRASLVVEPRSVYLLRGPARTHWEHSIPAVDALRYSITFRTLDRGVNSR